MSDLEGDIKYDDLIQRLDFTYESTGERHFVNAKELLKDASEFRFIVYAALELRLAIERICFEYLALITHRVRKLSKKEKNLYRPKDLLSKVTEESPNLPKIVDVINATTKIKNLPTEGSMVAPDSDYLVQLHGKLSDYLHLQKEQLLESRAEELLILMMGNLRKLKGYMLGRAWIHNVHPTIQSIIDDYLDDKIDKSQMEFRLKLADIPDHFWNA